MKSTQLIILLAASLFLASCDGGPEFDSPPISDGTEPPLPPVDNLDESAQRGKDLYTSASLGCLSCHGPDGQSTAFQTINPEQTEFINSNEPDITLDLVSYIEKWMPTASPESCDADCARDIAAYIRTWDAPAPPQLSCADQNQINYGRRQIRLLTAKEYENTLYDLLGFEVDASLLGVPSDTFISGFSNQVLTAVTQSYADAYADIAKKAATHATDNNFSSVVDCNGLGTEACGQKFVDEFGLKAFRRPLTDAERQRYVALFTSEFTQGDVNQGLALAIETVLGSPYFLMRSEMGVPVSSFNPNDLPDPNLDTDAYILSPFELATFLAYTYTGSMPDDSLLQAAMNNQLANEEQIRAQIERLLVSQRAREHFGEFAAQWLRTDRVLGRAKDATLFPNFSASVRKAMAQEVREIFKHVMFDGNQPINELYGDFTFLNSDLADFYGITGNFGNEFTKVEFPENRGGILASGAFMAGFANIDESSPIQRGVAVREDLMCLDVPPMPNDLESEREQVAEELAQYIEDNGGAITNRERTHFLTKDAPCSNCHEEIINPHGFGMEDFDAIGLHRTNDLNNLTIDPDGSLIGLTSLSDGASTSFSGTKGLSGILRNLSTTRACFTQKSFRFVMGTGHEVFDSSNPGAVPLSTDEKRGYSCVLEEMNSAMVSANKNPREALRVLGVKDIVRYRK